MGLQSIKVVAVTGNIDAPIGSETANLGSFGVVANLNEVRHAALGRQLTLTIVVPLAAPA
jgi:hypothetical protein